MSLNARRLHPFPSTHWTLIAKAGGNGHALAELLSRYLLPLRSHLMLRLRLSEEDADDILQGFVSAQVLEKRLLGRADRNKGRFRTFLLTALDRYVLNQKRSRRTRKRSMERATPLESLSDIPSKGRGPKEAFDLLWAQQVLHEATERMRLHCQALNRCDLWEVFQCRVLEPIAQQSRPPAYKELVDRFGYDSPSQASNAVLTSKRIFVRSLRSVVAEYEADEKEIDLEVADLRKIVSHAPA